MNKSTSELLEILKKSPEIDDYIENEHDSLVEKTLNKYLKELLEHKNIAPGELIKVSGLDRTYTYQILSGTKTPSRDKVLAICFGLKLSFKETQSLLKCTGYPILYARIIKDSIIIFALQRNVSLTDTNELLYEYGFDTLG